MVIAAVVVAVASAALVVVVVAVASAALVVFTVVMVAALVPLAMAVVVAVRACVDQFAPEVRFDRLIRVAGCACADFDPRIAESVQRSAAETAADQHLNILRGQKACQGAVPDAVRADHFARNDLIIFYFIHFELLCPAKVLKDISVVIGYRDFHILSFGPFCSGLVCLI